ncbi:MAG: hypothetical protein K8E66_14485, partial [Phycisphaerales bacterium]|nr:hypothetical protein [Phycisphaerales bacterium]
MNTHNTLCINGLAILAVCPATFRFTTTILNPPPPVALYPLFMPRTCTARAITIGPGHPLVIIAGP